MKIKWKKKGSVKIWTRVKVKICAHALLKKKTKLKKYSLEYFLKIEISIYFTWSHTISKYSDGLKFMKVINVVCLVFFMTEYFSIKFNA